MKSIEQVMRSFQGDDLSQGVELKSLGIAFFVSKKRKGSLVRCIEAFHRVAMVKHICHLCTESKHSIWLSWVRNHLIKNRNFWTLRIPGESSWRK